MGPQGSGKSTLARMIVRGSNGLATSIEWDEARRLSNAQIRTRYAAFALVCVEATGPQCRHADLLDRDAVLQIHTATQEPGRAG